MTSELKPSDRELSSDGSWTFIGDVNEEESTNWVEEALRNTPRMHRCQNAFQIVEKPKRKKKIKKTSSKSADPTMNFMLVASCLLTIIGLTLLTTLMQFTSSETLKPKSTFTMPHADPDYITIDEECVAVNDVDCFNCTVEKVAFGPYEEASTPEPNYNLSSILANAKHMVMSPAAQMFAVTFLQDICLIKLISELSKHAKKIQEASKKKKTPKKKTRKPLLKKEVLPDKSISETAEYTSENGKSECERRYEELENRWTTLGENHWQKIQQIKTKYQKELSMVKDHEAQSLNQTQKINAIRDKYLRRLKKSRETYLRRLRKLKEDRQRTMSDICKNSKELKDFSNKDASVGNSGVFPYSDLFFLEKLAGFKNDTS